MHRAIKLLLSIAISFSAGAVGNLATSPNIPTWYAALEKPVFNPPNWVFGPVWTLLYILMGVSLYLVWSSPSRKKGIAYTFFGVQLVLNALWSIVFFGLHQPWLAVVIIVFLFTTIVMTMWSFLTHCRWAAWLLIPYLGWVGFATALNIAVAHLNPAL